MTRRGPLFGGDPDISQRLPQDRVWSPLGHKGLLSAAMHGTDLLYLPRDVWPWGSPMRRREFIALLGGAITSQPIPANAQLAARVRTVAVLRGLADDAEGRSRLMGFGQGLEGEGWAAGRNLRIRCPDAQG